MNQNFLLLKYPEFRSLIYFRLTKINFFNQVLCNFLSILYTPQKTLYIYTGDIGYGIFIEHGFSTIVSAVSIGNNLHVNQNTTIGWSPSGAPIILNDVKLGCNSIVIGNITKGNNVIIGAGTVVTKNVPDNAVVVGNPARIIKLNGELLDVKL
jgi:serine O-acetyltransferase